METIEIHQVTPEEAGAKPGAEAGASEPRAPSQADEGRRIEAPSPSSGAMAPSDAASPAVYRVVLACASYAPEPSTSEGRS